MLELREVCKCFRVGGEEIRAADGLRLRVEPGELLGVLGPSGSGKTTLLLLAAGMVRPDSGEVRFQGRDLGAMSKRELLQYRRAHLGFVQQTFNLVPGMSARENVALPLLLGRCSQREARRRALGALDAVGLADHVARMPEQLSGGEQQRVAIARALIAMPELVLADEPTGNLDSATGEAILERLSALARERGAAVVLVTHDERLTRFMDRRFLMRDGRLSEPVAASSES